MRLPLLLLALACALGVYDYVTNVPSRAAPLAAPTIQNATWIPVNNPAFDLPSGGDYAGEEAFELVVFNNQLYVGMEGDNSIGARLWRSQPAGIQPNLQADWEEVIADPIGDFPFGTVPAGTATADYLQQHDHIDSLAGFGGYLYASTANRGGTAWGTMVYRSASGDLDSWDLVMTPGFGDTNNTNFKDMQVFDGYLCGGTYNTSTGAEVWCTNDGTTWVQKNTVGFEPTTAPSSPLVVGVWSGYVYNNALYFGTRAGTGSDDFAMLWRTTDLDAATPTWERVYDGPDDTRRVDILGGFGGYLYISTYSSSGIQVFRSPSGDSGTWVDVTDTTTINGNGTNRSTIVDGAAVSDNYLYVAVRENTITDGVEVWRTDGTQPTPASDAVMWERVGPAGLNATPDNSESELVFFDGELYAWTTNYATGQRVFRLDRNPATTAIELVGFTATPAEQRPTTPPWLPGVLLLGVSGVAVAAAVWRGRRS